MNLTILAFNYGHAGKVVNGPGMCLVNFVKFLKNVYPEIRVDVFTYLEPNSFWTNIKSISDSKALSKSIIKADVVHLWSGINDKFTNAIRFANGMKKKVIIGPNVLDTVEFNKEKLFLAGINYDLIFTVNEHLRFQIAKKHNINLDKIKLFIVGPDPDIWYPSEKRDDTILWKGNGKQFVKNVSFAKEIERRLSSKYKFKFIGYPNQYDYFDHIEDARNSKLLIVTSISETMGLAMAEAWQSGVPSVSHPKIYLHGENYRTGIITSYDIDSYIQAIDEIMNDDILYKYMSNATIEYMNRNFSSLVIVNNYMRIINE